MTLTLVGTNAFGRRVYTGYGMICDAVAPLREIVAIEGPAAVVWNGIPVTLFPGMLLFEFLAAYSMAMDSKGRATWPRQMAPFSPEIDPFVVTDIPDEDATP